VASGLGRAPGGAPSLDLIAIGRVSVDLYGQQIGSPLEEVATFLKGVGGCPANVAIGAARLGLKSALITRVGDEPMGHFVREQLVREGVDVRGVQVDPQRLTALVLLSVRDQHTFPLIFYRENCADAALEEADIGADFVATARAVLLTGTHFSLPGAAQAQRKAMAIAKAHGRRVILDVDYRPNLWGIGGHAAGESRYARSTRVTQVLGDVLPECDLIVGTEEELHIAAGCEETLAAVRRIRGLSRAVIVCKRGARGCIVFAGAIPASLEQGLVSEGRPVEIYNVLGAGDAFLAGYLRGYLRDAPHEECARIANACGALAVSRLLCSAEFPTLAELEHYLANGSRCRALREDPWLNHLHRVTTRRPAVRELWVLSLADSEFTSLEEDAARRAAFRRLVLQALARVRAAGLQVGVRLGAPEEPALLNEAAAAGLWVAQSVERAGSRPLEFAHSDSLAVRLTERPVTRTVSCRCQYDVSDPPGLRGAQEASLLRLAGACYALGREFLLEILPVDEGTRTGDGAAAVLTRLYALGIRPDWWALAPQEPQAWQECARVIAGHDPYCRGVLVCAPQAPERLGSALAGAAGGGVVQGLMAGGTILEDAARRWLCGQMSDEAVIVEVSLRLSTVIELWTAERTRARATPASGTP
jgi:5-dehydro-2-deoxygluconokinase